MTIKEAQIIQFFFTYRHNEYLQQMLMATQLLAIVENISLSSGEH